MAEDRTQELLARLDQGIADLTTSEAWIHWLDTQRRFHEYSFGNVMLISLQSPDATRVAGFRTWLTLGRHVRKGEKGIAILAPIVHRSKVVDEATGEETVHVSAPHNFRVVHVFDLAQTDGEELPAMPISPLTGDDPTGAFDDLLRLCHNLGYTVELDAEFSDSRNGDCNAAERKIRLGAHLEPAMRIKTGFHELGHALMHSDGLIPRPQAELEAESLAYLLCADMGLSTDAYSFAYLASWGGGDGSETRKAVAASASRIINAFRLITDQLVPQAVAA